MFEQYLTHRDSHIREVVKQIKTLLEKDSYEVAIEVLKKETNDISFRIDRFSQSKPDLNHIQLKKLLDEGYTIKEYQKIIYPMVEEVYNEYYQFLESKRNKWNARLRSFEIIFIVIVILVLIVSVSIL